MIADYVPAAPTRQLATPRGIQNVTYGVNAPGRAWNQQSAPLSSSELRQTWGATGTVNFAGIIVPDFQDPAELEGDRAIATYDRMWRSDGTCAALLAVYLLPLLQATYSIQAATDDDDDVAIAQETSDNLLYGMSGMTWHRFLRQLYQFRGVYGHAVFEKCWTLDDAGAIRLRKLAPRLARTLWRWYPNDDDELDRIQQRVWVQNADGITGGYEYPYIPAQKLLVSVRAQIGNNWLGVSLYRPCYKHWYYKDQFYAIDGVAAAKNAMGVPVISETVNDPGVVRQQSDRQLATSGLAAYQVNERGYFYMPYGYQFDLKAVSGAVRDLQPSIQHHDLLITRSFLAQFINIDSGGTLIAARDSSSFFLQALMGEAVEVSDDINPVIREMEEYNHAGRRRYSTLQMQDLDQRDMESYIRGVAALLTSKGLTPGPELENAFRDNLGLPELPAAATPAGGGAPTVDQDSQGAQAEDPADKADRQAAAGIAPGSGPDVGGDPGEATELARLLRRTVEAQRYQQARALVQQAGRMAFRNRRPEAIITVPRANGESIELHRRGGQWEMYNRRSSVWGGVSLAKQPSPYGRDVQPGDIPEDAELVDWVLGSGGESGTHCPECVELAKGGPYRRSQLKQEPKDGKTYCGPNCTCTVQPHRAMAGAA